MEGTRGRRRSSSFHSDPDAPPLPDFSGLETTELEAYEPTTTTTETEDEELEEIDYDKLIQSRSRSQSLQDSDEDISKQIVANAHVHPIVTPKVEDKLELVGPIHDREVSALKQGLEEAAGKNDEQAEKEEQAELMAAARERLKRASTNSSTNVQTGVDPINRKVKVLLLGDSGVGKSSIIQRYISDTFCPSLVSTLGVDLKTKRVHVDDKSIQVQVWDTAGQAAFHKITTSYYKGSNAILLVYDISDRQTFTNIEYWVKSIKEKASKDVQVMLLGNKSDLRQAAGSDCVSLAEGQKAADKYKVMYVETSAMTSGAEVEEAFNKIIHKVLNLEFSIKNRFSSTDGGTRSPEAASIFKKDKKPPLDKMSEGDSSDSDGGTSSPGCSPDGDGKKKDCVIS